MDNDRGAEIIIFVRADCVLGGGMLKSAKEMSTIMSSLFPTSSGAMLGSSGRGEVGVVAVGIAGVIARGGGMGGGGEVPRGCLGRAGETFRGNGLSLLWGTGEVSRRDLCSFQLFESSETSSAGLCAVRWAH